MREGILEGRRVRVGALMGRLELGLGVRTGKGEGRVGSWMGRGVGVWRKGGLGAGSGWGGGPPRAAGTALASSLLQSGKQTR